jgi:glycosyltransferase involved in cell wall biosynthesis
MPTNGDFIQRHAEAVAIKNNVTAIHIISDENCNSQIEITDKIINEVRTIIGYVKFTKNPALKYLRFIKAFRKISKKLKSFDVVHLNRIYPLGIFALYLKYFKKKPFIVSEHWTGFLKGNLSLSFFEKFISKKITRKASFICTVSQNLADSMIALGLKGKYTVIPNVVDTNLFRPHKTESNEFSILHISNMIDAHKNVSKLLHVVSQLRKSISDFKLILIGNESDAYFDLIQKLSLQNNVEIIPQIEHYKVPEYMQKASVFILFSNYENLPCVILESFSCGLPVISTDVGGVSEFFPKNFGKLITKQDSEKLLESILHFYKNKKNYDATKMHQYVIDNFSTDVIGEAFLTCYSNAIYS